MHTATALTIRPLPTRLAGVLEGRAADCRGDAHLGRRETRPQAASDWGTSMVRAEWYLTTRLCANSILLRRAVMRPRWKARADPWQVLACGSDGCFQ
jgi:hypothetical protein